MYILGLNCQSVICIKYINLTSSFFPSRHSHKFDIKAFNITLFFLTPYIFLYFQSTSRINGSCLLSDDSLASNSNHYKAAFIPQLHHQGENRDILDLLPLRTITECCPIIKRFSERCKCRKLNVLKCNQNISIFCRNPCKKQNNKTNHHHQYKNSSSAI